MSFSRMRLQGCERRAKNLDFVVGRVYSSYQDSDLPSVYADHLSLKPSVSYKIDLIHIRILLTV